VKITRMPEDRHQVRVTIRKGIDLFLCI